MTSAALAAVQVTKLSCATDLFTSRGARDIANARCQRLKDLIEMPHRSFRSTDHHAISALQAPDPAAGSNIHIVYAFGREILGAPNVVHVMGVSAVAEDVAALEVRNNIRNCLVHNPRWDHQPTRPGLFNVAHEF